MPIYVLLKKGTWSEEASMRMPQSIVLGSVVLLFAAACSRGTPAVGGLSPLLDDSVTITVVNDNYYDAGEPGH